MQNILEINPIEQQIKTLGSLRDTLKRRIDNAEEPHNLFETAHNSLHVVCNEVLRISSIHKTFQNLISDDVISYRDIQNTFPKLFYKEKPFIERISDVNKAIESLGWDNASTDKEGFKTILNEFKDIILKNEKNAREKESKIKTEYETSLAIFDKKIQDLSKKFLDLVELEIDQSNEYTYKIFEKLEKLLVLNEHLNGKDKIESGLLFDYLKTYGFDSPNEIYKSFRSELKQDLKKEGVEIYFNNLMDQLDEIQKDLSDEGTKNILKTITDALKNTGEIVTISNNYNSYNSIKPEKAIDPDFNSVAGALKKQINHKEENTYLLQKVEEFKKEILDDFLIVAVKNQRYKKDSKERNSIDEAAISMGKVFALLTPTSKTVFSSVKDNNFLEQYFEITGSSSSKWKAYGERKSLEGNLGEGDNSIKSEFEKVIEHLKSAANNPSDKDLKNNLIEKIEKFSNEKVIQTLSERYEKIKRLDKPITGVMA